MPEITINITVDQMRRLYNVLDTWEIVQTELARFTYGISEEYLADRVMVANIKNRIQQEIDKNT